MRFPGRVSVLALLIFACGTALLLLTRQWPRTAEEALAFGSISAVMDPSSLRVLLQPNQHPCASQKTRIIVVVHSQANHLAQRNLLRRTVLAPDLRRLFGLEVVFVVARLNASASQRLIEEEHTVHGDLLQIDVSEHYFQLTNKAVSWLHYLANGCPDAGPAVLKLDEDVFVEWHRLAAILVQHSVKLRNAYWCHVNWHMPIMRDNASKWKVPFAEMAEHVKHYTPYCSGLAYLTSTRALRRQWQYLMGHRVRYHRIDDFFLTGKLAAEAGVRWVDAGDTISIHNRPDGPGADKAVFFLSHERLTVKARLWQRLYRRLSGRIRNSPSK